MRWGNTFPGGAQAIPARSRELGVALPKLQLYTPIDFEATITVILHHPSNLLSISETSASTPH
jgi:hypothetical protein